MKVNYPLFIASSDWHIKPDNTEKIKDLIRQKIKLATERGVKVLICLGDVFQSRQAQPLIIFKCFEEILDMINEAGMTLYCIPGNHDKTNYQSPDSFLDQFQWHPAFELMGVGKFVINIKDWYLHFLPYYSPDKYLEELSSLVSDYIGLAHGEDFTGKEILLTHTAFEGSINNDGSTVSIPIKPNLFKGFFKVFSGHYHNQQQISGNIFHLPSLQANNYSEDNDKGFTVFNIDGNHELINSEFGEYHTIKVNLDEVKKEELNEITKQASELIKEQGAKIRFTFEGSQDKVQTVKKEDFTVFGIDIQKKHSVINNSIERAKEEKVIVYNKDIIKTKFASFCADEGYGDEESGYLYGLKCLNKKLEQNG